VRTAARAAVECVDRHDAKHPFARRRLSETRGRRRILEAHGHRPILPHDLVRATLGLAQPLGVDRSDIEVERRAVRTEVDAHRLVAEQVGEHGGQEVLPRVLLHVVEPALPVDLTTDGVADGAAGERRGEHVRDALLFINDVRDGRPADGAEVERLAA
jgi:hypothetical protein